MPTFRITIVRATRPKKPELNEDLQWLCNSLGLFSLRDRDKSMFRIFVELLKGARQKAPLTSDQLAYRTELSRGTVVHHINKLIEAGLVVSDKNTYLLRVHNLEYLIDELERDLDRALIDMRAIARRIDQELGL
ncbi:MAG: winged helix-turn-helix domain-containing protein [Nanoarchaeota archaeon]